MAKKRKVDEDNFDDVGNFGDYENVESEESIFEDFDARRRLENILEDRALERLIKGYYE